MSPKKTYHMQKRKLFLFLFNVINEEFPDERNTKNICGSQSYFFLIISCCKKAVNLFIYGLFKVKRYSDSKIILNTYGLCA